MNKGSDRMEGAKGIESYEQLREIVDWITFGQFRGYCEDRSMKTLDNPLRMEDSMRSEDKVIHAIRAYHEAEAFLERSKTVVITAADRVGEAKQELARQIKNFAGQGVPVWWDGYVFQATETSDCRLVLEIAKCTMRVIREGAQSESRVDVTAKADHSAGD